VTRSISVRRNPTMVRRTWHLDGNGTVAVRTGGFVHRTYIHGGQSAVGRPDGWDQPGAGEAIHQPSAGRKKKSRDRLCKATSMDGFWMACQLFFL